MRRRDVETCCMMGAAGFDPPCGPIRRHIKTTGGAFGQAQTFLLPHPTFGKQGERVEGGTQMFDKSGDYLRIRRRVGASRRKSPAEIAAKNWGTYGFDPTPTIHMIFDDTVRGNSWARTYGGGWARTYG